MKRRSLLLLALALGGCHRDTPGGGYLLIVTTGDGVSVVDEDGRVVRGPWPVAAASPDWTRMVTAVPSGAGTRVAMGDWRGESAATVLRGGLEPRVVSVDGRLVASVTPGGAGIYGLHDPGGRERTTVVVSEGTGEKFRLDLPGNLEPEAFSPDGRRLYTMDFQPAQAPTRYRAAVVDLETGRLTPLEAEPTTAHRVSRVHDSGRARLFALCAGPDEAYVHRLDLDTGEARRVVLPRPFGIGRPGVHAVALDHQGRRLTAIHSLSATIAEINPDRLVLKGTRALTGAPQEGKPGLAFTASGRLAAAFDGRLIADAQELLTPGQPRGLVTGPGEQVWLGHPEGVVRFDLSTGAEIARIPIPGLYVLKQVLTVTGPHERNFLPQNRSAATSAVISASSL